MSLLPANIFPGAIFLEARLLGQPAASFVSQVGLSVDARDCSVAVFSRASGVLLVAGVGSYCAYRICSRYLGNRFVWMLLETSRYDPLSSADRRLLYNSQRECEDGDGDKEGNDEKEEDLDAWAERVSVANSQFSRSSRVRNSARSKGLLALRHSPGRRAEGVLSRSGSAVTSTHRSGTASPSLSDRSASLRIVWEAQEQWDDEFATQNNDGSVISRRLTRNCQADCPSTAASQLDLCSVFDDVMSMRSAMELDDAVDMTLMEDEQEADISLDHIKCMKDSKYMYKSTFAEGSESGSICGDSVISARSHLSRVSRKQKGLWQLSAEEPSTSSGLRTEMTDSGLGRSTNSKRSWAGHGMFDSALGAEVSSEDGSERSHQNRFILRPLTEDSQSEISMEWFDDPCRVSPQDEICDGAQPSVSALDWELDPSSPAPSNLYLSEKGSPVRRAELRVGQPSANNSFVSRDLMALACQQFATHSPQFKLLHQLYDARRLRRIGAARDASRRDVSRLFLGAMLHHGWSPTHQTAHDLQQNLSSCLHRCDFLTRWEDRTPALMVEQLRTLTNLTVFPSSGASDEAVDGLEVLIVLEAINEYERKMRGETSWFTYDSPADVLLSLKSEKPVDEVIWQLLSSACDVSIELIDVASTKAQKFGSAPNSLVWLRFGPTTLPLLHLPD